MLTDAKGSVMIIHALMKEVFMQTREALFQERHSLIINPFHNTEILDSSKLKEFADDNFKFGEKSRKFSERVENTVGKGEIARYEQFLLFPQCFQKTLTVDM